MVKAPSVFAHRPNIVNQLTVMSWLGWRPENGAQKRQVASLFGVGLRPGVVGGRDVVSSSRHFGCREPSGIARKVGTT